MENSNLILPDQNLIVQPERNDFYVYVLLNEMKCWKHTYGEFEFDAEPFYIGKGHDDRCWDHLEDAAKLFGKPEEINKYYNPFKIRVIHKIWREIGIVPVKIIKCGLTDKAAKDLEIKGITTVGRRNLGLGPLVNLTDGGDGLPGIIRGEEWQQKLSIAHLGLIPANKGKTNIEMFGIGRAMEISKMIIEAHLGKNSTKKDQTYEQLYGIERAEELRKKLHDSHLDQISLKKGKTNIELYGEEKAKEISKKQSKPKTGHSNSLKGKTWEEIYGVEVATEMRKQNSISRKGKSTSLKGKSWEVLHGEEKAKERKRKQSESHKGKPSGNKDKKCSKESCQRMSESQQGQIWIYNSALNVQLRIWPSEQSIPEGFIRGRRPFSVEHKLSMRKPKSKLSPS